MTNEQYEKLVELVNSIQSVDKELIDTNMFIAKFHKIFSKDYEAPITYPWTNKPGVRDIETPRTPFYPFHDPMQIIYDSAPEHNPNSDKHKIDIPEEYKFTKFDKTNGVDKMEFTVSDDNTHSIHKTPREVCCEDPETSFRSIYTDPRNLDTTDT